MKTKQIVLGLLLIPLLCFLGNSAFAIPESVALFSFIGIAIFALLLPIFIYRQMKNDMVEMQKTIDALAAELTHMREVEEALNSRQHAAIKEVKKKLWDELGQAEKDEHIAKIQKSMRYTGSTSPSQLRTKNRHDIIPIGA